MVKEINNNGNGSSIAKINIIGMIIVAMISSFTTIIVKNVESTEGNDTLNKTIDPTSLQGFRNIKLDIEGKWKYQCVGKRNQYKHGGHFYIRRDDKGAFILKGERMWVDTLNPETNKWVKRDYSKDNYKNWNTTWIFVKDNSKFYFEYEVRDLEVLARGYSSGDIRIENNEVVSVSGEFFQFHPRRDLSGSIFYEKIPDLEYEHPNFTYRDYSSNIESTR